MTYLMVTRSWNNEQYEVVARKVIEARGTRRREARSSAATWTHGRTAPDARMGQETRMGS
jgi:hypothetical protein